jgi:hypothetical protein
LVCEAIGPAATPGLLSVEGHCSHFAQVVDIALFILLYGAEERCLSTSHVLFLCCAVTPFRMTTSLTHLYGGQPSPPGVTRVLSFVGLSLDQKSRLQGCEQCVSVDQLPCMSVIRHTAYIPTSIFCCMEAESSVDIPPLFRSVLLLVVLYC